MYFNSIVWSGVGLLSLFGFGARLVSSHTLSDGRREYADDAVIPTAGKSGKWVKW